MTFRSKLALVAATIAASVGGIAGTVAPSHAYTHDWICTEQKDTDCFDNRGTVFNPWVSIQVTNVAPKTFGTTKTLCALGITAAGNLKSGSACATDPAGNMAQLIVCLAASPSSLADVYWSGTVATGYRQFEGYAHTEHWGGC